MVPVRALQQRRTGSQQIGMLLVALSRSASVDRRSEDISVLSIVVAELELGYIQRHVLGAHLVERAHHAALKDRPEAFDCLSVNGADNVLALRVVNGCVRKILPKAVVANPLIGTEQAHLVRYRFPHEGLKRVGFEVFDNAGDDVALATDSANDGCLAGTNATSPATLSTPVPMLVLGEAADEGFIDLDNAAKFANIRDHGRSDFVAHVPSRAIRAKAHVAVNLMRAHAFLANEHEMGDAKPVPQRLVSVLKDRADRDGEPISCRRALVALPMPFACGKVINGWVAAPRAMNATWPPTGLQIALAGIFIGKHRFKFSNGKLCNWLGLLAAHSFLPAMEGYCHA